MAENRVGFNRSATAGDAAHRRDQRADLRREADGLAVVRVRRVVGVVDIVVTERRRQRPQQVHAVSGRQRAHQPKHWFRQRAGGGKLRLQVAEFGARRQPAMPEEITDFLERRVPREVVNVVAAVGQHAAVAVEVTDRRRTGDGVFESGFGLRGRGHIKLIIPRSRAPLLSRPGRGGLVDQPDGEARPAAIRRSRP